MCQEVLDIICHSYLSEMQNEKPVSVQKNENEIKIELYVKLSFWVFILVYYLKMVFGVRLSGFILFENVLLS